MNSSEENRNVSREEGQVKTTKDLMNSLQHIEKNATLKSYVSSLSDHSPWKNFAEYLTDLIGQKGMTKSKLIRESGLDRTYCYQIFDGSKNPGRDKILTLLITAHANLKEVQRGLEIAEEGVLYPRKRRDAIIIFSIRKGMSVEDTDDLLEQFHEKTLL